MRVVGQSGGGVRMLGGMVGYLCRTRKRSSHFRNKQMHYE